MRDALAGVDRVAYYHLLVSAADAAALAGDIQTAIALDLAAEDVADDLVAELMEELS